MLLNLIKYSEVTFSSITTVKENNVKRVALVLNGDGLF